MTGNLYAGMGGTTLAQSTIDLFHEEAMKAKERGASVDYTSDTEGSSREEGEPSGFERVLEGMKLLLGQLERLDQNEADRVSMKLHWRPLERKVHEILYSDDDATSFTSSSSSYTNHNFSLTNKSTNGMCMCGRRTHTDYIHYYKESRLQELPMKSLLEFLNVHNLPVSKDRDTNLERIINTIREEELNRGQEQLYSSDEESLSILEEFDADDCDEEVSIRYADADALSEDGSGGTLTPIVGWHGGEASPLPKIPEYACDDEDVEEVAPSPPVPMAPLATGRKTVEVSKCSFVKRLSIQTSPSSVSPPTARRDSKPKIIRHNTLPAKTEARPSLPKRRASEGGGSRLMAMTAASSNKVKKPEKPKKAVSQPQPSKLLAGDQPPRFMKPTTVSQK
eukprot:TRINITY_DN37427_c0_g1_i4.p1 TRINITY_DN37427_c0_g1~~TRINITY_DN37427_c0_g1_i4.p1  ORF type:complete len:407 (+),score=89.24 TRINITY_DN37427_c0_g1_i4:41-1222(+)